MLPPILLLLYAFIAQLSLGIIIPQQSRYTTFDKRVAPSVIQQSFIEYLFQDTLPKSYDKFYNHPWFTWQVEGEESTTLPSLKWILLQAYHYEKGVTERIAPVKIKKLEKARGLAFAKQQELLDLARDSLRRKSARLVNDRETLLQSLKVPRNLVDGDADAIIKEYLDYSLKVVQDYDRIYWDVARIVCNYGWPVKARQLLASRKTASALEIKLQQALDNYFPPTVTTSLCGLGCPGSADIRFEEALDGNRQLILEQEIYPKILEKEFEIETELFDKALEVRTL